MSLLEQIREVLAAFEGLVQRPALIGGLALAAHRVVRSTRDIDFLIDADDAALLHERLERLGYRCLHRSEEAANYLRGSDGLDLLYAHRPEARRLLGESIERNTALGRVRVIGLEGLIAFKLQALVNDPTRHRDVDDIRQLLANNAGTIDLERVRGYFALFERHALLDQLLRETGHGDA